MIKKRSLALGIALLTGASTASAEGFGVALNTGIVGLGIGNGLDIVYSVHPSINLRGGFMQGNRSLDTSIDKGNYTITSKVSTMGLYADWLIFQGDLRLTVGYVANNGSLDLVAEGDIDFGDGEIVNTELEGNMEFKSGSYAGIGWGNAVEANDTIGFNMDIGVLLDSDPTVNITKATNATDAQVAKLENKTTERLKMLPVITIGLTFHF